MWRTKKGLICLSWGSFMGFPSDSAQPGLFSWDPLEIHLGLKIASQALSHVRSGKENSPSASMGICLILFVSPDSFYSIAGQTKLTLFWEEFEKLEVILFVSFVLGKGSTRPCQPSLFGAEWTGLQGLQAFELCPGPHCFLWRKMSIAEQELHWSRGLAHGEYEFHCFSGRTMMLVSLCSWLVASPLGTSGTHRALTVNARVENISVVFEGAECQVTKSCPGRKSLFFHTSLKHSQAP